ncbi:MAG: sodium:solute symporter family transporter [Christensenellales bacterium]
MKYFFLAAYALIMVLIAVFARRGAKNVNEFVLGGRNVGPWLSAFAYGNSYFSSVIFIGYAGRNGWNFGVSSLWIAIGNAIIGSLLAWVFLAKPARSMTQRLKTSTMPEFFNARYSSKWMKIISSAVIFIFLVPYSASVYQGLGNVFESLFGIPFIYCMILMATLTLVYLLVGGYLTTVLGDFFQGIVIFVGVGFMLFFLFRHMGGVGQAFTALADIGTELTGLFSTGVSTPFALLSLVVLTSFGPWGLPQMVHKFYAIKDEKSIPKSMIISTIFALLIGGGAYGAGAFSRVVLNNVLPSATATSSAYDMVMPNVFYTALPEMLMGLIVVLMLSASISTLSSLVLTSAATVALDLFKGVLTPNMSQKNVMILMRSMCVVFVAASVIISITSVEGIVALMSLSWGTVAGASIGPFVLGLKWRGATKAGAWAGMIGGLAASIGLTLIMGMSQTPVTGSIAMAVSFILTWVVSLLTKKPESDLLALAFGE